MVYHVSAKMLPDNVFVLVVVDHDVSFIFSDLLGNTTPQFSSFILQHNMFQPSGPDHMLNKTGKVLNDFRPLPSPESESQFKTKLTILEC